MSGTYSTYTGRSRSSAPHSMCTASSTSFRCNTRKRLIRLHPFLRVVSGALSVKRPLVGVYYTYAQQPRLTSASSLTYICNHRAPAGRTFGACICGAAHPCLVPPGSTQIGDPSADHLHLYLSWADRFSPSDQFSLLLYALRAHLLVRKAIADCASGLRTPAPAASSAHLSDLSASA